MRDDASTPPAAAELHRLVHALLEDLRERVGLDHWVLARRNGEDYVVIDSAGPAFDDSTVLDWDDTFCALNHSTDEPTFVPDVQDAPAFAALVARRGLDIGSVVSVTVQSPGGRWTGWLCGQGRQAEPDTLRKRSDAVRLTAGLLGSLMESEVHLAHERRRADLAELTSHTDALTGAGNRRAWDQALVAEEARLAAVAEPASVVVVDVDDLKVLNDASGHAAGDAALRAVATVLASLAEPHHLVARLGGDEFGVLMPGADQAHADDYLDRAGAQLRAQGVAASAGAHVRRAATGLSHAWQEADAAMYRDKEGRRRARRRATVATEGGAPQRPVSGTPDRPKSVPQRLSDEAAALLDLVRAQLGLDVAFINERQDDRWQIRRLSAAAGEPIEVGMVSRADNSYCELLTTGQLPSVVPDARAVPVLAAMPATGDLEIGAHLGVPLHRSDGRLYGTLCAFSHRSDTGVSERDAHALRVVGDRLMRLIEEEDQAESGHHQVLRRLDRLRESGGPTMVFQPVVRLSDGAVLGHEALARFPEGSPADWFEQARSVGMAHELEIDAIRAALARLGDLPGDLAVNVSASTLCGPALAPLLLACDTSRLLVEITEHVPVDDYARLREALAPLRAAGVRLSIDDVGAGYASMRHVLELLPDVLKLDISLVRDLPTDPRKQALTAALVTFAAGTGAELIAEGIETQTELDHLRRMGVAFGQGYHLGRPAPL